MITSKRIKATVKDDDSHSLCLIRKLYTCIKWVSNEKKLPSILATMQATDGL